MGNSTKVSELFVAYVNYVDVYNLARFYVLEDMKEEDKGYETELTLTCKKGKKCLILT